MLVILMESCPSFVSVAFTVIVPPGVEGRVYVKRLVRHASYPWHWVGAVVNVAEGPGLRLLEGATAVICEAMVVCGARYRCPYVVDIVYIPFQATYSATLSLSAPAS